ncbi:hypothetical protein AALO_G00282430, partial [Alosa alosa]
HLFNILNSDSKRKHISLENQTHSRVNRVRSFMIGKFFHPSIVTGVDILLTLKSLCSLINRIDQRFLTLFPTSPNFHKLTINRTLAVRKQCMCAYLCCK